MNILFDSGDPIQFIGDALIVGFFADYKSPVFEAIDTKLNRRLSILLEGNEISAKPLKSHTIWLPEGIGVRSIILVGLGNKQDWKIGGAYQAAAVGAKVAASSKNRKSIAFVGFEGGAEIERSAIAGSITGGVGQDTFRADRNIHTAESIRWFGIDSGNLASGIALGECINLTRRLVNLPANYLYPETFVEEAKVVTTQCGLQLEVWDEDRLKAERCNSLLAVSSGSERPPRLCIIRYAGKKKDTAPIALVGKGVTFDSGGLSIKPSDGMLTMKCDMAGAATVLGTMVAAARLGLEQPLVGLVGLTENMISGASFKLGDVLTARSGKTIEIHNTDAEGRLVLADVLNVALDSSPSHIIDLATLTGACCVALGNDVVGVMSNDESWQSKLLQAANQAGEYVWPLPMYPFYSEQIAGKIADIKNVGEGRWGGAITAAKFLEEFVDKKPWIHLDIAGPAFLDSPKPWSDAGASGTMLRTLIRLLEGN